MANSKPFKIECKKVTKKYNTFFALRNISFHIEENGIYGIVGANGAGKTTLIKILSGLLGPTSGDVLINGMAYKDKPELIKQDLGVILDKSFLYEDFSIEENLKFHANIHGIQDGGHVSGRIEEFTKKLGINSWIHEPIKKLSMGMRKKVEIIRLLMHDPGLLIIDEPFVNLDFKTINQIMSILTEMKEKNNSTIILTTHNLEESMKICDQIMVLKKGKISKIVQKNEFDDELIKSHF